MAGMVKKILTVYLLLAAMLMTSCTLYYHRDIDKNGKTWIKYFEDEDAEGLYDLFCSDIKENYSDETKEEIEKAFEFIDGDITSHRYKGEGAMQQAKNNYKTYLYWCIITYYVETDKGEKYTIDFSYNYIRKENPEYEGVDHIRIIHYRGDNYYNGKEVEIGRYY